MIWFLLGGAGRMFSEYLIHRFVGHGPRRTPSPQWWKNLGLKGLAAQFNHEHLAHHADPSYFAPTSRKAMAAVVAVPLVGSVASLTTPR